jgi:hypothetical protein
MAELWTFNSWNPFKNVLGAWKNLNYLFTNPPSVVIPAALQAQTAYQEGKASVQVADKSSSYDNSKTTTTPSLFSGIEKIGTLAVIGLGLFLLIKVVKK